MKLPGFGLNFSHGIIGSLGNNHDFGFDIGRTNWLANLEDPNS